VWRDDLKLILSEEQQRAVSVDDFRDRLAVHRVELRERGKEKNFSYGFIDAEAKVRQARALGPRGLGASYGREAMVTLMQCNQDAKDKASQRAVLAPKAARVAMDRTLSLSVVVEPGAGQQERAASPVIPESDSSWMDDVIAGLALELDANETPSETVSVPPSPDCALEPAVVPAAPTEPVVASVAARKGSTVVRTPDQKRALALLQDQSELSDEHDRSV
jgi:hypothetical protein